MKITIELDEAQGYATVEVAGLPRYWLERSGCVWVLRTGNGFNHPVKTWRITPNRQFLAQVIPIALAVVLAAKRDTSEGSVTPTIGDA